MDDLESLVFTFFYITGVPGDRQFLIGFPKPEGLVLLKSYEKGNAKDKMLVGFNGTSNTDQFLDFFIFLFNSKNVHISRTQMFERLSK